VRSLVSLALLFLVSGAAEARQHHRWRYWRYYDEPRVVVRQVVRELPAKACRAAVEAPISIGWPDPWIDALGLRQVARWRL
jgi:hypothetical protein